ncbi:MAG: RluA family pseudouridine synthase [Deltaproteobacteria bacterium]|nr:RluA family pseudouridine synthase [Deltaproteobacteria bacterium]
MQTSEQDNILGLETFSENILYEDNHLLAVYKPAGMLTQGDRSGRVSLLDLGKEWLRVQYNKPGKAFLGLLHRLDRPVSGVVLFAKTSKAAGRLSEQFRNRIVKKVYLAVIHSHLTPPQGDSIMYLVRDGSRSTVTLFSHPKAQRAELSYRTLQEREETSLVRIVLRTGRRHQIRAQLAALGHPIVGDRRYGSPLTIKEHAIALQAHSLTFLHPISKEEVYLEAPMPELWPWKF